MEYDHQIASLKSLITTLEAEINSMRKENRDMKLQLLLKTEEVNSNNNHNMNSNQMYLQMNKHLPHQATTQQTDLHIMRYKLGYMECELRMLKETVASSRKSADVTTDTATQHKLPRKWDNEKPTQKLYPLQRERSKSGNLSVRPHHITYSRDQHRRAEQQKIEVIEYNHGTTYHQEKLSIRSASLARPKEDQVTTSTNRTKLIEVIASTYNSNTVNRKAQEVNLQQTQITKEQRPKLKDNDSSTEVKYSPLGDNLCIPLRSYYNQN